MIKAVLDTRLTEELKAEGERNEVVHAVNRLRRAKGYHITDRVEITLPRDTHYLDSLLAEHKSYIMAETLATNIKVGENDKLIIRKVQ